MFLCIIVCIIVCIYGRVYILHTYTHTHIERERETERDRESRFRTSSNTQARSPAHGQVDLAEVRERALRSEELASATVAYVMDTVD